ncbi:hypothetical protein JI735_27575 [Paenibacillus sonchi]|uniref:Uncharacterized protein n=1 Tax=Paenibacillus sonchi TaxID=373687 RepID=A0A974PBB7_9BACL|nr:hypothetical protein [Paenibacillus sonchi]QQZ60243.1 hypothetical protein JI735_27575 [Paenibacillus sonchi]
MFIEKLIAESEAGKPQFWALGNMGIKTKSIGKSPVGRNGLKGFFLFFIF